MAAYATLLSLNFTIDQHQQRSVVYPPQYPIRSSVKETITFLLKVFKGYDYQSITEEIVELEREIAEAAYDVDYVIECLALDPVLEKSGGYKLGKHSSHLFSEDEMIQIINKFLSFGEKAMKEVVSYSDEADHQMQTSLMPRNAINDVLHTNRMMMGYQKLENEFFYHLRSAASNLQIAPVVGMGGIRKTTFVRNIFYASKENFDVSRMEV